MVLTRDICDEIKSVVNQAVSKTIKSDSFINEISQKVIDAVTILVENKIVKIEQTVAELKTKNEKLESKILELQNNLEVTDCNRPSIEEVDRLDQAARACNLRIFNLEEKTTENLKQEIKNVCKQISVEIAEDDILLCYRVGKARENKSRGIFLKIKDANMKQRIYGNKKLLKGTGIVIKEDLTPLRLNLMKKAVGKLGFQKVWTINGKILVKFQNKIVGIKCDRDLMNINM